MENRFRKVAYLNRNLENQWFFFSNILNSSSAVWSISMSRAEHVSLNFVSPRNIHAMTHWVPKSPEVWQTKANSSEEKILKMFYLITIRIFVALLFNARVVGSTEILINVKALNTVGIHRRYSSQWFNNENIQICSFINTATGQFE